MTVLPGERAVGYLQDKQVVVRMAYYVQGQEVVIKACERRMNHKMKISHPFIYVDCSPNIRHFHLSSVWCILLLFSFRLLMVTIHTHCGQ